MSISILIVEDERIVAEDIRMALESNQYVVAGIAASRDQALEAVERTAPDLVLMDIILKGPGDGVETARLVRERFDIPVVYLTAHADTATLHRAKITEPFGYILKPFQETDLFTAIQMALYRHRMEKRLLENQRWLTTILGSISDGVIAADAMGVVRLVNAAAERIGGWQQAEAMDCDLNDIYRTRDVESGAPVEVPILPLLMEEHSATTPRQKRLLIRSDGGLALVEQSIAPITDASNTISGSVIVFRELPPEHIPGGFR